MVLTCWEPRRNEGKTTTMSGREEGGQIHVCIVSLCAVGAKRKLRGLSGTHLWKNFDTLQLVVPNGALREPAWKQLKWLERGGTGGKWKTFFKQEGAISAFIASSRFVVSGRAVGPKLFTTIRKVVYIVQVCSNTHITAMATDTPDIKSRKNNMRGT